MASGALPPGAKQHKGEGVVEVLLLSPLLLLTVLSPVVVGVM